MFAQCKSLHNIGFTQEGTHMTCGKHNSVTILQDQNLEKFESQCAGAEFFEKALQCSLFVVF